MIFGEHVIELKPSGHSGGRSSRNTEAGSNRGPAALVTINGQDASISSDQSATIFDNSREYIVKVFAKPNGEITVKSQKFGMTIKYYGDNMEIYVSKFLCLINNVMTNRIK